MHLMGFHTHFEHGKFSAAFMNKNNLLGFYLLRYWECLIIVIALAANNKTSAVLCSWREFKSAEATQIVADVSAAVKPDQISERESLLSAQTLLFETPQIFPALKLVARIGSWKH